MKNNDENNSESKRRKYILATFIFIIFLLIGLLIYIILNQTNAHGQIVDFKQAAKDKDYNKISKYLSSGQRDLSKNEAKAFINYINNPKNSKRFDKEINEIEKNVKENNKYAIDLGAITDSNGKKIINVKKDGKKFFFIEKLKFAPNYTNVYVKENDNTAVYNYNTNKEHQIVADKNRLTSIGTFFTGKYNINAKKKIEDTLLTGESSGKLEFNTEVTDKNNKVVAIQNFDQSSFKINLKNSEALDNSKKVVVDGKEEDYVDNKIYGHYFNNDEFKVHVAGTIDGKEFVTNDRNISINKYQSPQEIDLSFNQDSINKFEQENKEIENKGKKFMIDYTNDLNQAYKKSDYKYISDYIEEDSKVAKHMKKMVESKAKNKYSNPQIDDISKDKDKLKVILTKEVNNNKIQSKYSLKYNKDTNDFKIIEYTDI
ncbi:TcaA NTF2-like domain-containing protein [Staphylococcus cohnii]|uniref:TcaA NTF2-like domain-containing protein n=1 Tax=Staphylococcus cohnii TaxID=29382 RepID=UPI003D7E84E8